ncbi:hypothetical protein SAMN02910451_02772 [Butyrivibrio hungatei]|uniref:Uncharacterized protein n=1 Tax=Butyrivibrio hungatei TaxID=185008 RepID=A0A1G5G915_9FIRM|nr:hypothetical protein [Butyrivibrio hungatei]SCY48045.1 hypothetical protein SAMN02910451_02772 [Butyrivibrio hungatei]
MVIKQKKQVIFGKVIFILCVILFDLFLIRNCFGKSLYILFGTVFLVLLTVKGVVEILNEIYSFKVSDTELSMRLYCGEKTFPLSDVERVYAISAHNVSFNKRYGFVRAIGIVINKKIYFASELYRDFDSFEKYMRENYNVVDVEEDKDISI